MAKRMEFNDRSVRAAWSWYVVYCVMAFLLHVGWVALCFYVHANADQLAFNLNLPYEETAQVANTYRLGAKMLIPTGIFFGIGSLLVLKMPRNSNAWWTHMVNLIVGSATCVLAPLGVPLIFFFLKPEMKAAFGREPSS